MFLIFIVIFYLFLYVVYSQCTITKTINNLLIKEVIVNDVKCQQNPTFTELSTPLPSGINFDKQTLKFSGSASRYSFNTTYEILFTFTNSNQQSLRFYLAVFDSITKCTYGHGGLFILNIDQTANIDGPRCNTPVFKFGISPLLPGGLSFSNSTGRITGSAKTIQSEKTYIITPYTYNESEVSITISLTLRIEQLTSLPIGLYARYTPQGYCVNLTKYDMYKHFDDGSVVINDEGVIPYPNGECSTSDCDWEQNINKRHRLYFCMKIHGYLYIQFPGEYHFSVRADESAFLFVNNEDIPLISSINKTQTQTGSIQLQPGLIRFGVLYHQSAGPYHLEILWKTPDQTVMSRIGETYFRYNSVPLQNLHYVSNYLLFLNNVPRRYSPYYHGTATGFKLSEGNLPNGLELNTNNGIISGTPLSITTDFVIIKITAYSSTGNTTSTVHIKVLPLASNMLKSGVRISFYRIARPVNCYEVSDVYDGYHSLIEVEYESDLSRYGMDPFPSIIQESTHYIVKFMTLINIPATRKYTFKLYSSAGSYMVLDTLILNNWGCDSRLEKSISGDLTKGLHYLEVTYYINPTIRPSYGIELFWDYPDGIEVVIPYSYYRFLPEGSMQYTERTGKHFVGSEYPANKLIYHSLPTGQQFTKFRVYPNLPSGLTLNSGDGTIEGKLLGGNQRQTQYLITGETYDTSITISTVLTIELDTNRGVSGLFYHTGDHQNVTKIEGDLTKAITPIYPTLSGDPVSYEVTDGGLPIGIHLNRDTGVISGTPAQEYDLYVVITAANALSSTSVLLTIKIQGCTETTKEYFLFYMVNFDSDINVVLRQGATELFKQSITSRFTETSYGKCLDNSTAVEVSIISKAFRPPFVQLKKSGSTTMFFGLLEPYKGVNDVVFTRQISLLETAPKITFSTNMTAYTHIECSFYGTIEGGLTEIISVTPPLPSGLGLLLPGVIYGKSNSLSSLRQYTVKYKNRHSEGSSSFYLEVINCVGSGDDQLIGFKLVVKAEEDGPTMSILLKSIDYPGINYYTYISFMPYAVSEYSYCVDPSEFQMKLDSTNGKPWELYSYAEIILDNGIVLFHKSFNGKDKEFIVDLHHYINQYTPVNYLYSNSPPLDWCNSEDFRLWEVGNSGSFKTRNTTTQYYKYHLLGYLIHKTSVIIGVQYDAGIIIRINSKEIYKNNLPDIVNPDTKATGLFDSLFYTKLTFTHEVLNSMGNSVCIELHNHQDSASYNPFGFYMDIYANEISPVHLNSYIYGEVTTQHDDRPGYPVSYLFDDNPNTQWETRSGGLSGTFMIYKFLNRAVEFVNCYAVVTGDTPRKDPITWKLYGVVNKLEVELSSEVNQTYNDRQLRTMYYFNNNVSYDTFKWDILRHGDSTGFDPSTAVADFLLYSCSFSSICPSDGHWKSSLTGETVTRPCNAGYSGSITRECTGKWENPKENCVKNPPLNIKVNGESNLTITAYRRISFTAYIRADGAEIIYSVTPDLPKGLSVDRSTGRITGIPEDLVTNKLFTARATNGIGDGITATFYLTLNSNFCSDTDYCHKIEQGDFCLVPCDEGYKGTIRSPCIPSYKPYYGDPDFNCVPDKGSSSSSSKGLGAGGIIGIIFGLLAVCVFAFVGYRYYLYRQGRGGSSGSRSSSKPIPPRNKNVDPYSKVSDI